MESIKELKVITAETYGGSALIVFSDGKTAIYSAALLASIISQAEAVEDTDPDEL